MKTLPILVLALLAAGCASAGKPISIGVQEDGSWIVDGQPAWDWIELRDAVEEKAEACRAAGPMPKVVIQVQSPEEVPYENLAEAILACGRAGLEQLEIGSVPLTLPHSGWHEPSPFTPAFAPIEIRGAEDLDGLRAQPEKFRSRGILIYPMNDTPTDLVIAVMKTVHEAGGKIALAIPYDAEAGWMDVAIVLSHLPLDKNGKLVPAIIHPFSEDPFPDALPANPSQPEVIGVAEMAETAAKEAPASTGG